LRYRGDYNRMAERYWTNVYQGKITRYDLRAWDRANWERYRSSVADY